VIGGLLSDRELGIETIVRGSTSRREPLRRALCVINPAWICVLAGLALSLLGVYAIDVAESVRPIADGDLAAIAWKQVVFLIIGMLAATIIALPHYRVLAWLAWPGYVISIGLLVFLLVPWVPESLVTPRNGARGWIDLGVVDFQPSEPAKVAYVLAIAQYMRYRSTHRRFKGLIVPGLISLPPVALITLQPDLGTASLFVPALGAMLVAAGARLRHLALICVAAACAAPAAYPLLRDHQKVRIVGLIKQFQGDDSSAQDINFQSYTAQNLIGAGRESGMPSVAARALVRYNALPERHNDTVFAVIASRFGFVGGFIVIGLNALWVVGACLTAATSRVPQGRLIAVGLAGFVAAQSVVNIGMNLGLLPIIGITLPFVSYGGSSIVTSWLMTGLVLNVGLHPARPPFRSSFEYPEDDDEQTNATRSGRGRRRGRRRVLAR
jgi:cell division protein FtsW (lipid II flippase)